MDVRSISEVEPEVEHNGTVPVWWMIRPREMKDLTDGGYLELGPGDLVYIPPGSVHSLETIGDDPIHCFCFAVGTKDAGTIDYTTH